jgi:hypothetical protein
MDIDLHADLLRGVKEGEGTCGNGITPQKSPSWNA